MKIEEIDIKELAVSFPVGVASEDMCICVLHIVYDASVSHSERDEERKKNRANFDNTSKLRKLVSEMRAKMF